MTGLYWLPILAIIFLAQTVRANTHFPVTGDRASTIGHLKMNFDKMPGGQANDSVFLNSLSLGLGERVEVGVIPWVYTQEANTFFKYGMTLKYNFYKSEEIQVTVGGSQIKGLFKDTSNSSSENTVSKFDTQVSQWMNYLFTSINYSPKDAKLSYGLTIKYTEIVQRTIVHGGSRIEYDGQSFYYPHNMNKASIDPQNFYSLDLNYQLTDIHWLGLSVGTASLQSKLNADTVSEEDDSLRESERIRYILGSSYIYYSKWGAFENPRISITYFEANGFSSGFSVTF